MSSDPVTARSPPYLSWPATGEAGCPDTSVECSNVERGGGSSWLNTATDERSLPTSPSRVAAGFESVGIPLATLADGSAYVGKSGPKALHGGFGAATPLPVGFSWSFMRRAKSRIGGCCQSQLPTSQRPARQIAICKMRLTVERGVEVSSTPCTRCQSAG